MRSTNLVLVGLMVLSAAVCSAQTVSLAPNALGLYFDGEASGRNLTLGAAGIVEIFLVYTEPTLTLLDAWEAKITIDGAATILAMDLPLGSTAVLSGPEDWSAEMVEPMPCNSLTKLAIFTVESTADDNTNIFLGNVDNPSVPGDLPGVRVPGGEWVSVPVPNGDPSLPVAGINSSTPNETTSWGAVKSLFR